MSASNVITDNNCNYNVTIFKNANVSLMSDILFGSPLSLSLCKACCPI